jgi:curved DNA-binding protein
VVATPTPGAGGYGEHSDFFEALFGRRGAQAHRRAPPRAQDHHAKVVIDLADAYRGAQRGILPAGAHAGRAGSAC